jgi:hypothetical protein
MHDNCLMGKTILRVIEDSSQLVARNQKNILRFKFVGDISLDDSRFARDEPDEHMIIKYDVGFEKLVLVTGEFDVGGDVFGLVIHDNMATRMGLDKNRSIKMPGNE